jgi:hypothetical protein
VEEGYAREQMLWGTKDAWWRAEEEGEDDLGKTDGAVVWGGNVEWGGRWLYRGKGQAGWGRRVVGEVGGFLKAAHGALVHWRAAQQWVQATAQLLLGAGALHSSSSVRDPSSPRAPGPRCREKKEGTETERQRFRERERGRARQ